MTTDHSAVCVSSGGDEGCVSQQPIDGSCDATHRLASALIGSHLRSPDRLMLGRTATFADAALLAFVRAERLRFTTAALVSAAELFAPTVGYHPNDIYSTLKALDLLAIEYAKHPGDMRVRERANEIGLRWTDTESTPNAPLGHFAVGARLLRPSARVSLADDRRMGSLCPVDVAVCDGRETALTAGIYVGTIGASGPRVC